MCRCPGRRGGCSANRSRHRHRDIACVQIRPGLAARCNRLGAGQERWLTGLRLGLYASARRAARLSDTGLGEGQRLATDTGGVCMIAFRTFTSSAASTAVSRTGAHSRCTLATTTAAFRWSSALALDAPQRIRLPYGWIITNIALVCVGGRGSRELRLRGNGAGRFAVWVETRCSVKLAYPLVDTLILDVRCIGNGGARRQASGHEVALEASDTFVRIHAIVRPRLSG